MKAYVYIACIAHRQAFFIETLDEVAPAYTATVTPAGNVLMDCRVEDLSELFGLLASNPKTAWIEYSVQLD
jgi:hypothetical protein